MLRTAPAATTRPGALGRALVGFALLASFACGGEVDPEEILSTGIREGDAQVRFPGSRLETPLTVALARENGSIVGEAGRSVTWSVTSGGGSIVESESQTSTAGTASATWRLGPSTGQQTVTARIASTPSGVTFTATAVEPGPILLNASGSVAVLDRDGSDLVFLGVGVRGEAAWSPDGSGVVFARRENLAVLTDLTDFGEDTLLAFEQVGINHDLDWSPDGTTVVFSKLYTDELCGPGQTHLFTVRTDGSALTTMPGSACDTFESAPAWSPDGTQLAYQLEIGSSAQVWVMGPDGSNRRSLGTDGRWPEWLPDASGVVFGTRADFDGVSKLGRYDVTTDTGSDVWVPDPQVDWVRPGGVSPDGRYVAAWVSEDGVNDVFVVDLQTGEPTNITEGLDRPSIANFIGYGYADWRR